MAGVLGALAIVASMVLAMMGARPTSGDVAQALAVLGASMFITLAVILRLAPAPPQQRAVPRTSASRSGPQVSRASCRRPNRGDLIGRDGVAVTDLRPSGTARVGDERMDVVTEGEYVPQGSRVQVVQSDGYRHVVRAVL